jgi:hypothetical protein
MFNEMPDFCLSLQRKYLKNTTQNTVTAKQAVFPPQQKTATRRIQPKRYTKCALKFVAKTIGKTILAIGIIIKNREFT